MRAKSLLLFVIFFSYLTYAQTKQEKIDELISKYVNNNLFSGTVLVADESGVIFKKGYGYANLEWRIPNTPDVKFRLGSITKQFTSMIIMQLVQEGKLKLDGKISDYLDYYRKDIGNKVTIHHLLTHTSGIPSYTSNPEFMSKIGRMTYKPDDFVKEQCMGDLEFEPGSNFSYNNSGYFILGAIIEKLTGKSYEKNLQDRIFNPLGMKSSGYDWSDKIIDKRAAGYEPEAGGFVNTSFIDMSLPYSAGSLYSTVEDLYLWDRALYSDKLLNNELKEKLFTPYIPARNGHYAYGWFIAKNKEYNKEKEYTVISHGGSINGFNSQLARVIDDKKVVILLNNTGRAMLEEMGNSILNIMYDLPYNNPRVPVSKYLMDIVENKGIDEAINEYKKISREKPEAFILREDQLNNLGYYYLRNDRIKEALAIFKLNVDAFPQSFNVYDSYAEALMNSGEKDKSIENYKKSLELNPRNTGAISKLKEMGVSIEEKKDAAVSLKILKSYIGQYELNKNFVFKITEEQGRLFVQATGQPRTELFPESETKFYVKVVNAQFVFKKDEKGNVIGLTLFQNGNELFSKKLDE